MAEHTKTTNKNVNSQVFSTEQTKIRCRVIFVTIVLILTGWLIITLCSNGYGMNLNLNFFSNSTAQTTENAANNNTGSLFDTFSNIFTGGNSNNDAGRSITPNDAVNAENTISDTVSEANESSNFKWYDPNEGESWWAIAERNGSTGDFLAGFNGVDTSAPVIYGQSIKIPVDWY